MGFSAQARDMYILDFKRNWGKFLLWGIILSILGLIALSIATFTTLVSVILIGSLLVISGIVVLIDSITFWRKKTGFGAHFFSGMLYTLAGIILIANPVSGSISLTLILGICYTFVGLFRTMNALNTHLYRWKLRLLNGAITLLIGLLIMVSWPESSLYIIGLFVGIDLLVVGWVYIMSAIMGRNMLHSAQTQGHE